MRTPWLTLKSNYGYRRLRIDTPHIITDEVPFWPCPRLEDQLHIDGRIQRGTGAEAIKTIRPNTAFQNGQVRVLYRIAEVSLAERPQSWGDWVLGHSSSAGAHKLINIIERSVRSSHAGEENAKNDSKRPAPHPVWGSCGSCGAKLSSDCGYRRIFRRLLREVAEA